MKKKKNKAPYLNYMFKILCDLLIVEVKFKIHDAKCAK